MFYEGPGLNVVFRKLWMHLESLHKEYFGRAVALATDTGNNFLSLEMAV